VKRPVSARVGVHTYRLVFDRQAIKDASHEHGERLVGRCCTETLTVVVDPKLVGSQSAETVVHELLHAMFDTIGAGEDGVTSELEERLVRRLAPVVLGVLVDNPELVGWLQAKCA